MRCLVSEQNGGGWFVPSPNPWFSARASSSLPTPQLRMHSWYEPSWYVECITASRARFQIRNKTVIELKKNERNKLRIYFGMPCCNRLIQLSRSSGIAIC
mmetsp:Transcript_21255/g.34562  ORF Transcript_21255/g.34562 Transcript_21255/m.34562 type:complete len:100 (+) Transcript_21255:588-887(+)